MAQEHPVYLAPSEPTFPVVHLSSASSKESCWLPTKGYHFPLGKQQKRTESPSVHQRTQALSHPRLIAQDNWAGDGHTGSCEAGFEVAQKGSQHRAYSCCIDAALSADLHLQNRLTQDLVINDRDLPELKAACHVKSQSGSDG